MAITRTPMVDDDGTGTTGTVINNAWKQEFYDQIDASLGGTWTAIPYNPANFTAQAGTWTVEAADILNFSYTTIGKTMIINFFFESTSVLGATADLRAAIPAGKRAAAYTQQTCRAVNAGGAPTVGLVAVSPNGTYLEFYPDLTASTTWTAATNTTRLRGLITFEIQ
jgi:hypothetical protein